MSPVDEPDQLPQHSEGASPDEGEAFRYACPRCGHRLPEYREKCPECGAELADLFSATYNVPMSSAGRKIALIALIGLALLLLLLAAGLLSQLLATTPPAEGG